MSRACWRCSGTSSRRRTCTPCPPGRGCRSGRSEERRCERRRTAPRRAPAQAGTSTGCTYTLRLQDSGLRSVRSAPCRSPCRRTRRRRARRRSTCLERAPREGSRGEVSVDAGLTREQQEREPRGAHLGADSRSTRRGRQDLPGRGAAVQVAPAHHETVAQRGRAAAVEAGRAPREAQQGGHLKVPARPHVDRGGAPVAARSL